MGAWGGGSGGGGGTESNSGGPLIGVGVKRQRVGECRPAVSLLLRRKGDDPPEANAATKSAEGEAAAPETLASGVQESGGGEVGGLSMLAGYGSDDADES